MPGATRPTRSWLFTPGTWPNRFAKAAEIGADVLIIDLEDAVAPDDKPGARGTFALALLTGMSVRTVSAKVVANLGAYASRGGKSFIAAHSTAAKGKVSKIVARLDGPNTTPRIDTHWIVTEFGATT
jgi:hypothetical protein